MTSSPPLDRYTMQPIILSLESELPNEVAFALNSLLLLSKTWALPLPKYPKLLGVLLAHTGAAPVDSCYYKLVHTTLYYK